jgi:hypothetical protein
VSAQPRMGTSARRGVAPLPAIENVRGPRSDSTALIKPRSWPHRSKSRRRLALGRAPGVQIAVSYEHGLAGGLGDPALPGLIVKALKKLAATVACVGDNLGPEPGRGARSRIFKVLERAARFTLSVRVSPASPGRTAAARIARLSGSTHNNRVQAGAPILEPRDPRLRVGGLPIWVPPTERKKQRKCGRRGLERLPKQARAPHG